MKSITIRKGLGYESASIYLDTFNTHFNGTSFVFWFQRSHGHGLLGSYAITKIIADLFLPLEDFQFPMIYLLYMVSAYVNKYLDKSEFKETMDSKNWLWSPSLCFHIYWV